MKKRGEVLGDGLMEEGISSPMMQMAVLIYIAKNGFIGSIGLGYFF